MEALCYILIRVFSEISIIHYSLLYIHWKLLFYWEKIIVFWFTIFKMFNQESINVRYMLYRIFAPNFFFWIELLALHMCIHSSSKTFIKCTISIEKTQVTINLKWEIISFELFRIFWSNCWNLKQTRNIHSNSNISQNSQFRSLIELISAFRY